MCVCVCMFESAVYYNYCSYSETSTSVVCDTLSQSINSSSVLIAVSTFDRTFIKI